MSQKKKTSSPSMSNSSSDELGDSPVLPSGSPRHGGGYDSSSSSSASGEADIKDVDEKFNLLRAAEVGDLEEVKRIIAAEPDKVNLTDANGYTALHRACYNDHVEVARELISNGADYVKKTVDGWEPLHSAARWGATRCVEILLDLPGVDINAKTKGGVTPLHLAVLNAKHRETVIELLMHPGVDTRIVSEGRQTPFEVARSASELYRLFEVTEPMFNL